MGNTSPRFTLDIELCSAVLSDRQTLLIHYKNQELYNICLLSPKVVIIKVCHVSQQSFLLAKSDTAWWFETVPNCLAQLRVSTKHHGIDISRTHSRFVTGCLWAVARNRKYISLFQIVAVYQPFCSFYSVSTITHGALAPDYSIHLSHINDNDYLTRVTL